MEVTDTSIDGLRLISPRVFEDARGYFYESFNEREFAEKVSSGIRFVQDNQSRSCRGVVRGLHFQNPPYAQSKLVRVVDGAVLDVAVDLRAGSPTYGKYEAVELSADNQLQLFIPKGFAHGFAVLSEVAVLQYKCDEFYHPEAEGAIAWNDPDIAVKWPFGAADVLLSAKDIASQSKLFSEFDTPFK